MPTDENVPETPEKPGEYIYNCNSVRHLCQKHHVPQLIPLPPPLSPAALQTLSFEFFDPCHFWWGQFSRPLRGDSIALGGLKMKNLIGKEAQHICWLFKGCYAHGNNSFQILKLQSLYAGPGK